MVLNFCFDFLKKKSVHSVITSRFYKLVSISILQKPWFLVTTYIYIYIFVTFL